MVISATIYVMGKKMEAVDNFVYLGSTLSQTSTLNQGVQLMVTERWNEAYSKGVRASYTFGRLGDRHWSW